MNAPALESQSSREYFRSWSHPTVLAGDLCAEIAGLKQQPGKDIFAHGGAGFARSLIKFGLVDEFHLLVHPVALGTGLSPFRDLPRPLDLQLTRVRCEDAAGASYCGLTLSGVKFHGRVDTAAFRAEVDELVHGAFAVDPAIAEVDLWVTVPADAGKGAIVSGDFAMPSSATVFATTVPRGLAGSPSGSDNVFWDPTFRSELAQGSNG